MNIKCAIYLAGALVLSSCDDLDRIAPANISVNIESDTIVFAEIGDFGLAGMPECYVASMVKSWKPDFIISAGDNNYYTGKMDLIKNNITQFYGDYIYNYDAPEQYKCYGKAFTDKINRFFPTPGNHDANNKDKLKPYYNYFTLPGNESYYTFRWGPVSFFSINSVEGNLAEQKQWLLNVINRSDAPFNVVFFHHPPYSTGGHGNNAFMQWDFKSMGVDLVFTGHDHIYDRIEKKGEEGCYYIVNGLGGMSTYKCNTNPLPVSAFKYFCFGEDYGAIKAIATHDKLKVEFYSIHQPDNPIDKFEIEKLSTSLN